MPSGVVLLFWLCVMHFGVIGFYSPAYNEVLKQGGYCSTISNRDGVLGLRSSSYDRSIISSDNIESQKDVFSSSNYPRLVVFVNKKSGGKKGATLIKTISCIIPADQICDLSHQDPVQVLSRLSEHAHSLKVLCCGGDGTVGWIIGALRSANMSHVPVGVIPLGTGNDLVRTLESGYYATGARGNNTLVTSAHLINTNITESLLAFANPLIYEIDTWQLIITPTSGRAKEMNASHSSDRERSIWRFLLPPQRPFQPTTTTEKNLHAAASPVSPNLSRHTNRRGVVTLIHTFRRLRRFTPFRRPTPPPSKLMVNYFSIGTDGIVTMAFHKLRTSRPGLFISPFINKLWYGLLGLWVALFSRTRRLSSTERGKRELDLLCDGEVVPIPPGIDSIVVLNGNSYAGGAKLWNNDCSDGRIASVSDGLLEVRMWQFNLGVCCLGCNVGLLIRFFLHFMRPPQVVGLQGLLHLGTIISGMSSGIKLAQCRRVEIISRRSLPVQMDGEPWLQPAGHILLEQSPSRCVSLCYGWRCSSMVGD